MALKSYTNEDLLKKFKQIQAVTLPNRTEGEAVRSTLFRTHRFTLIYVFPDMDIQHIRETETAVDHAGMG